MGEVKEPDYFVDKGKAEGYYKGINGASNDAV